MPTDVQIAEWNSSRDEEEILLDRCKEAALKQSPALNQREANVFQLAGMILESKFPHEAMALTQSADDYFEGHPGDRLDVDGVLERKWIIGLPRLRDMLAAHLKSHL